MNIVVNSKFNPFTYEELVKPLEDYTKTYNEVADKYETLAMQTEAFRNIATQENSPEAYKLFSGYANDLNAVIDDFSRGMTPSNRRQLLGLKRRYASEIQPIADASKRRDELAAEQRKLSANNPDLMYDRDFSNISLDELMENPNLSYTVTDGKDLYNKGKAITAAMASRLHKVSPALKGQYYEIKEGFGEEAANQFLLDSNAIPELNRALEDLVNSTNVTDRNRARAFEYAKQGAISGMLSKTSYETNRGWVSPEDSLNMRILKQSVGMLPYREDADGTKYYTNKTSGETWKVDPSGKSETIKSSGDRGKPTNDIIKNRSIVDNKYPGYLYDPVDKIYYEEQPDGSLVKRTKEELNKVINSSVARRDRWRVSKGYNSVSNPVSVARGAIINDGEAPSASGFDQERFNKALAKGDVEQIPYGELTDDKYPTIKKWLDAELQSNGLKSEDIIIRRLKGGWGKDDLWDIKIIDDNSNTSLNPNGKPA